MAPFGKLRAGSKAVPFQNRFMRWLLVTPERGSRISADGGLEFAVTQARDGERVRILQFGGEHLLREVLEADRAGEAVDGETADGCEARVGGRGIRAAVNHGVGYFDAGGESVEDETARFLFEDLDEFAIRREVIIVAEDGCGQVAFECAGGTHKILRAVAVDQQCVRAKDFVGELRLCHKLIEADGEELRLSVERSSRLLTY
jgi:hypothetical protein